MSQWLRGTALGNQLRDGKNSLFSKLSVFGFISVKPLVLIVWNGETNGLTAFNAPLYEPDLRTCLDQLDVDWGPTKTIIVGINQGFSSVPFRAVIKAAQITVASERTWRTFIDTDPITFPDHDGLHYLTPGFQKANALIAPSIN